MKSYDVVGYSYQTENYCLDCMRSIAAFKSEANGQASEYVPLAELLDRWAAHASINHNDESSYDSGDFPKVIFADQAHDSCSLDNGYEPGQCADMCARCHEPIGFDCPNTETDE